jgi:hypothetical protein
MLGADLGDRGSMDGSDGGSLNRVSGGSAPEGSNG